LKDRQLAEFEQKAKAEQEKLDFIKTEKYVFYWDNCFSDLIWEIMEMKGKTAGVYVAESDIDRLMLKY